MDTPGNSTDTLSLIDSTGWKPLAGFEGVEVLTLASDFDEPGKKGRRTRLVRFAPGVETRDPLVHDYFEETFLLSGDVHGIRQAAAFGTFTEQAFVRRPPGTPHGPIRSEGGCVLLEMHYYPD
ncbi:MULTISPECIES: cupin domain-containing protein [unclassified Caballeronia]|uniref:cupin domain-containing protein n=1 Tax=unclassified Caballeronia TaxID=2646786 RepID=UPI0028549086|nr:MULTISPECIES: cupin domain-containing protein [unclassified Caballeronia]MDR5814124.1 cupin domain-containing protein [Caballeronia sp. LZ033]MDR5825593.1 cupin domain-containing protein [Caballeronia sp. LZ043]